MDLKAKKNRLCLTERERIQGLSCCVRESTLSMFFVCLFVVVVVFERRKCQSQNGEVLKECRAEQLVLVLFKSWSSLK